MLLGSAMLSSCKYNLISQKSSNRRLTETVHDFKDIGRFERKFKVEKQLFHIFPLAPLGFFLRKIVDEKTNEVIAKVFYNQKNQYYNSFRLNTDQRKIISHLLFENESADIILYPTFNQTCERINYIFYIKTVCEIEARGYYAQYSNIRAFTREEKMKYKEKL